MKYLLSIFFAFTSIVAFSQEEVIFELDGVQSMSITGQGPGQDAAINPYEGQDTFAIIKNIGENPFSIRVKDASGKTTNTPIKPEEMKKITLLKGSILYFDSEKKTKTTLLFKPIQF